MIIRDNCEQNSCYPYIGFEEQSIPNSYIISLNNKLGCIYCVNNIIVCILFNRFFY